VLVNNAGIVTFATLEDLTEIQWKTIISVNLTGPFLGIKAALAALKASAPSSIINISSTLGFIGSPGLHGYVRCERRGLCALLGHLAEWGDLRFGKLRIDEESSEGRIADVDRPPTAQIRSAQARRVLMVT
jgi:NAD(P)-dependent dehydrogenase (short-subunit alcohol dehydrogenase family)